MSPQARKAGSIAILTTIFTGLAVAVIFNVGSWAVGQINNVAPVVNAVDNLSKTIVKNQDKASEQFAVMSSMIYEQNARLEVDEHRILSIEETIKEHKHTHRKIGDAVYAIPSK